MTPEAKGTAVAAAKSLIQQKIEVEQKELEGELEQILAGAKAGTLDIREKKGRELFYRLMFISLAGSFGKRLHEIKDIDIGDLVDKLMKITRQLKEELSPNKGSLVSIYNVPGMHGVTSISAIDAGYDALPKNPEVLPPPKTETINKPEV